MKNKAITIIIFPMFIFIPAIALAQGLFEDILVSEIRIMKISAKDHRAVIRMPDDALKIIKVGDLFAEDRHAETGAFDHSSLVSPAASRWRGE